MATGVNGVVEISPGQGTSCLSLSGLRFKEATISGRDASVGPFSPADAQAGDICLRGLDAGVLSDILENPSSYSFNLELRAGQVVTTPLKPSP